MEQVAGAEQAKKAQRKVERRPTWTMDVMILSNLNEISKVIDENAMQVDAGNVGAMLEWKAGLKQFYRNIKSFFNDELLETSEKSFVFLDKALNMTNRSMPASEAEIRNAYSVMSNLNEMFYHARNELFMKFIEMVDQRRKTEQYSFAALPESEKQGIMSEEARDDA